MSQPALDLDLDDGAEPTYTVGELTAEINRVLRRGFGDGVWVRGEIQGWSERGPHAYFNLAEETEQGKATLSVQFFAPQRTRLQPLLRKHGLRLADGLTVRIFGVLDMYAGNGRLGLKMSGIDPRFTLGDLAAQRAEVVRRLVAAGVYDANRGRQVPAVPLRLGVVTSVSGAAWADFRHELERSGYGFRVRVRDVRVQGDQAARMVADAVTKLSRSADIDVVVIIRGGGARSDLAVFDDEAIATAIAASPVPVFTGLGHEIDRSIADDVAHSALKTPTACATALVEHVAAFWQRAEATWTGIDDAAARVVEQASTRLAGIAGTVSHHVRTAVEVSDERLTQREVRLRVGSTRVLERSGTRLTTAADAVRRAPRRLDVDERHLATVAERLRLLDPTTTLARGWSITRTADGRTVRDVAGLQPGDEIITTFAAGSARSTVEETTP